jgi:hypothetical protein
MLYLAELLITKRDGALSASPAPSGVDRANHRLVDGHVRVEIVSAKRPGRTTPHWNV